MINSPFPFLFCHQALALPKGKKKKNCWKLLRNKVDRFTQHSACLSLTKLSLIPYTVSREMEFNKTKCKVLHVGWKLRHKYRLGKTWIESSPEEKNSGVLVDKNLNMTQPSALAPQKANCTLDCIKRNLTSRARDMILPLYFLLVRPYLENCIQL